MVLRPENLMVPNDIEAQPVGPTTADSEFRRSLNDDAHTEPTG